MTNASEEPAPKTRRPQNTDRIVFETYYVDGIIRRFCVTTWLVLGIAGVFQLGAQNHKSFLESATFLISLAIVILALNAIIKSLPVIRRFKTAFSAEGMGLEPPHITNWEEITNLRFLEDSIEFQVRRRVIGRTRISTKLLSADERRHIRELISKIVPEMSTHRR